VCVPLGNFAQVSDREDDPVAVHVERDLLPVGARLERAFRHLVEPEASEDLGCSCWREDRSETKELVRFS
jgi:hypothetical protein